MKNHAAVSWNAAGSITYRSPAVLSFGRTGTGAYTLTLAPGYGIAASECAHAFGVGEAVVASGLVSFGLVHTSQTVKTISAIKEGAAGAASALADVAGSVALYSLTE